MNAKDRTHKQRLNDIRSTFNALCDDLESHATNKGSLHKYMICLDADSAEDAKAYLELNATFSSLEHVASKESELSGYELSHAFRGSLFDISSLQSLGDITLYREVPDDAPCVEAKKAGEQLMSDIHWIASNYQLDAESSCRAMSIAEEMLSKQLKEAKKNNPE